MKPFNWCFIGASKIAYKVADEIIKGNNCRIISVWNRTYEKALAFANKYNAKAYKNVIAAIKDKDVDGVYIALTNDQHFKYMKLCIDNNIPVLCEKPFTMNEEEARKIYDISVKKGVYVSEAMWTWHNKCALKVKQWVKENKVGTIKEVTCSFGFVGVSKEYTVERLVNPNLLGGCLLDIGVYGLRYTLELFGYPKDIKCTGTLYNGVDINEEVIFYYDNFKVTHHFSIDEELDGNYIIKGSDGEIIALGFHAAKEARISGKYNEIFKDDSLLYERQFANCAKEIKDGIMNDRFISVQNTILCMRLMDECRKQLGVIYPFEK